MPPRSIRLPRRSALDWTAAALVAAAVFVAPALAIGLANGGVKGGDVAYALVGIAACAAALSFYVRRRAAPPGETLWVTAAGGFLSWIVLFGGFIVFYGASFCGNGRAATTVSWVALFVVYFAVAVWALLGRYRPLFGLPLAVALAVLAHFGALAIIPGGRGYCET
jgi:hypothetical protein